MTENSAENQGKKLSKGKKRKKCNPATCGKFCKNCRYKKALVATVSDSCKLAKLFSETEEQEDSTNNNKTAKKIDKTNDMNIPD